MSDLPEAAVRSTRYTVSCLPEDHVDRHLFEVNVEYRGADRWAITRHQHCLGSDGTWDFGIQPYDRGDVWLHTHRFGLDTALRPAKEAAARVTVNGISVTAVLAGGADW